MTPLLFITYLLALMSCLNAAGQRDTLYVLDTIKYKDGSYRINLSDGNYRVTYPAKNGLSGGGYGTGIYKTPPVILPKKDTVKPGLQDLMVNSLDTINVISPDSLLTWSSGTMTQKTIPHYNTVRVMLLVCDTAAIDRNIRHTVSWQFGYEVRELGTKGDIINNFDGTAYVWPYQPIKHISYLDDRRRTLSKSIIVWQSIKL